MASIYYELDKFALPLPNSGITSVGDHHVRMARLAWAAATIGATPYGPRSRRRAYALELQWREAMMRASIRPGTKYHWRSASYARLDPSEKGAVSFFLGQAQAKLFAHDFFHISRFVHYDSYLEYYGQPRRRIRPDFIGFHGKREAIAVEAKGRSLGFEQELIDKAKNQVGNLPYIRGYPPSVSYAHVAYFDGDMWCAYLIDPPRQQGAQGIAPVDPAALTLAYYIPIVNAIRGQTEPERVQIHDNVTFLRRNFAEVDCSVAVREDIATLVPSSEEMDAADRVDFEAAGVQLYDLALSLDESTDIRSTRENDSEFSFVGPDGVSVALGSSWENWRTEER